MAQSSGNNDDSQDRVTVSSVPVSRENQEKIIAAMKRYLPSDATLFLLDYEMDVFMGRYFGFEVAAAH